MGFLRHKRLVNYNLKNIPGTNLAATLYHPRLSVITGATSGIGLATAWALAEAGSDLVLTGRRNGRLESIKQEIEAKYSVKVHSLNFDVSKRSECEQTIKAHQRLFFDMDLLVNNAGMAKGLSSLQDSKIDDWEQMIDTNIKGLLYMTRLLLPIMLQNKKGHIINLGSVAGRWTYPKGGVYCATKFAVRALTESLRLDLLGTPIRVSTVDPGMVETEFSLVRLEDEERAKAVYHGMTPLRPEDVAQAILWCAQRPLHVNVQEVVLYPTDQASTQNVFRRPQEK